MREKQNMKNNFLAHSRTFFEGNNMLSFYKWKNINKVQRKEDIHDRKYFEGKKRRIILRIIAYFKVFCLEFGDFFGMYILNTVHDHISIKADASCSLGAVAVFFCSLLCSVVHGIRIIDRNVQWSDGQKYIGFCVPRECRSANSGWYGWLHKDAYRRCINDGYYV